MAGTVPHEDPAPRAFGAVGLAAEQPSADAGFDHHFGQGPRADVMFAGPPAVHAGGEDVEGGLDGRLDGEFDADLGVAGLLCHDYSSDVVVPLCVSTDSVCPARAAASARSRNDDIAVVQNRVK